MIALIGRSKILTWMNASSIVSGYYLTGMSFCSDSSAVSRRFRLSFEDMGLQKKKICPASPSSVQVLLRLTRTSKIKNWLWIWQLIIVCNLWIESDGRKWKQTPLTADEVSRPDRNHYKSGLRWVEMNGGTFFNLSDCVFMFLREQFDKIHPPPAGRLTRPPAALLDPLMFTWVFTLLGALAKNCSCITRSHLETVPGKYNKEIIWDGSKTQWKSSRLRIEGPLRKTWNANQPSPKYIFTK